MKLNFSVFRTMMLVVILLGSMAAQARVITGTVKDPTGETIISASVVVKGTTLGTVTDFDGNYTLEVPDDAKVLIFSYIGMKTQELNITGDVMNVVLSENSEVLEEVVVTGYGTTKKRDLVTAVSSVSADQIKDVPVANAAEALQGKLAGVSVMAADGAPDADVKIRVRGGTSLTQSNDPLYIVDGSPVSSISDIAPSDIASMDVLKDAAATAIYGAQGANGVIIITTKDANINESDDKMQFHFTYSGYVGWRKITKMLDVMDNRNFMLLQYENAYLREGSAKMDDKFAPYFIDGWKSGDSYKIADMLANANNLERTNWQEETFGRTGFDSNHSFSVNGGNKNANFNISYNRVDNKAIMYGSDFSRDNISLKAKFKPIKNMNIAFNTRYSDTRVNGAGSNTTKDAGSTSESRVRNSVVYTPVTLYSKDAESLDDEESYGGLYNPLQTIDDNYKFKKDQKLNLNGYISYKFAKYFTWRSEVGYDYKRTNTNRFYGPTTYMARTYTRGNSIAVQTMEYESQFRQTNTFNYSQTIKSHHNLNVTVGEEILIRKGEERTMTGIGYEGKYKGKDVFNHLSNCTSASYTNYILPTDNMLSFFARADYNYRSRYYASLTFRADGTTRFAKENQWGYFPSAAIAWNIAEEDFMEPSRDWLSQLKLRFSYGTAGNNNVDLGYLHSDFLSSTAGEAAAQWWSGFSTMLTVGGSKKIAANPNLKWETTITRDLGLDFGFFNQRLSGTLDLYLNSTRDLIVLYPLSSGYNYQYRNIGSTQSKGVEFSLSGVALDKRTGDLNYNLTISANIAASQMKITDLGGVAEMPAATSAFSTSSITYNEFYVYPGGLVGDIYGYETDGWYKATDFKGTKGGSAARREWTLKDYATDGVVQPHESMKNPYPGMIKLKDQNGDGKIDEADRVKLGNTMPICQGGFSLNFNISGKKWGMVDLGANFTYSIGNKVLNLNKVDFTTVTNTGTKTSYRNLLTAMNYGNRYSMFDENGGDLVVKYLGQGMTVEQMTQQLDADNAGANIWSPYAAAYVVTDYAVEDGSFLRLNQLTLGYSLPDKWISKAYITKCRIYVQGSNLFTVTKYSGFDPEVDVYSSKNPMLTGVDYSAYPRTRGINVGVNLSF